MRRVLYLLMGLAVIRISWVASVQAQSSRPQAYSLSATSHMTEVSMFTGQVSNLKVNRSGSKELVELTVAPWAANPKGIHQRHLFDFQAHKAYSKELTNNSCAWMNYVSARAPVNLDPITGLDEADRAEMFKAKGHAVGAGTVNGIPARIMEFATPQGTVKMWLAQKGDFPVKMEVPGEDGKFTTYFEVKQVDFSPPAASLFETPANCSTQTAGEWSDHGMNAHVHANINVQGSASANTATGETHEHFTATMQQTSPPAGSTGSAQEFEDAIMPPMSSSGNSCTVMFRIVRVGTMEPVTSGYQIKLDNRDVTAQYRDGILRISNPPPHFEMIVAASNGQSWSAGIYRQCFGPATVLLLEISPGQMEDHWYWVKSGKYATVPR